MGVIAKRRCEPKKYGRRATKTVHIDGSRPGPDRVGDVAGTDTLSPSSIGSECHFGTKTVSKELWLENGANIQVGTSVLEAYIYIYICNRRRKKEKDKKKVRDRGINSCKVSHKPIVLNSYCLV